MKNRLLHLLPWYVNNSLPPDEKRDVEIALSQSVEARQELAELTSIAAIMTDGHVEQRPSPAVWTGIKKEIRTSRPYQLPAPNPLMEWASGFVLACIILVFLWMTVRPGVALAWRVDGESPEQFRIYRAIEGSEEYQLVSEMAARDTVTEYQYIDATPLPLKNYVYRVEGVGKVGRLALSQTVSSSPLSVLPGQLAILLTSILLAYLLVSFMQTMPLLLHKSGGIVVA